MSQRLDDVVLSGCLIAFGFSERLRSVDGQSEFYEKFLEFAAYQLRISMGGSWFSFDTISVKLEF
jgi:hypothetical protein